MTERASLEELLEFANKVREAGGGNPLDALMPAVPEDSSQCLIARNLNFNCEVQLEPDRPSHRPVKWIMSVGNRELRDRIAKALNLETGEYGPGDSDFPVMYYIMLPDAIGQVAADFDKWAQAFTSYGDTVDEGVAQSLSEEEYDCWVVSDSASEQDKDRLREFWPYIEESAKEACSNALTNERGELIL